MLRQALVFTDMDGTLLDHHNYDYSPALNMLDILKSKNIPVIPTTSKTKAELEVLMANLQLNGPFIVENGAAIYIPKYEFTTKPEGCLDESGFWVKKFANPRAHWLELLAQLHDEFIGEFVQFSTMNNQQIIEHTGLDEKSAQLANTRLYSEPVKWIGTPERQSQFVTKLQQLGANVLQGGRFLGVSGPCDKGKALLWLVEAYQSELGHTGTLSIALGDSNNDVAMLNVSDLAVRVKSPSHSFPSLSRSKGIYDSTLYGPAGWSECLSKILICEC
ncbi:HAD-IIB family hydrolase [Paraglaciecola sp. 20A4]|uniref:HAD-IIB family hydrolase n=1 Tax=Paraglaciecola sp. 20A4 TaxID=2687288 RepID=UPI001409F112|nr:HAD-IIB family hydrolase [Paraglaciecola sp. 20A4]